MLSQRYRAYTAGEAGRSIPRFDEAGNPVVNSKGQHKRISRVWPAEHVAFEGKTKDDVAAFDAGDTFITRISFLDGPLASEVVVGSVDIGTAGKVEAACPIPDDDDE